jgi:hypothetical protein
MMTNEKIPESYTTKIECLKLIKTAFNELNDLPDEFVFNIVEFFIKIEKIFASNFNGNVDDIKEWDYIIIHVLTEIYWLNDELFREIITDILEKTSPHNASLLTRFEHVFDFIAGEFEPATCQKLQNNVEAKTSLEYLAIRAASTEEMDIKLDPILEKFATRKSHQTNIFSISQDDESGTENGSIVIGSSDDDNEIERWDDEGDSLEQLSAISDATISFFSLGDQTETTQLGKRKLPMSALDPDMLPPSAKQLRTENQSTSTPSNTEFDSNLAAPNLSASPLKFTDEVELDNAFANLTCKSPKQEGSHSANISATANRISVDINSEPSVLTASPQAVVPAVTGNVLASSSSSAASIAQVNTDLFWISCNKNAAKASVYFQQQGTATRTAIPAHEKIAYQHLVVLRSSLFKNLNKPPFDYALTRDELAALAILAQTIKTLNDCTFSESIATYVDNLVLPTMADIIAQINTLAPDFNTEFLTLLSNKPNIFALFQRYTAILIDIQIAKDNPASASNLAQHTKTKKITVTSGPSIEAVETQVLKTQVLALQFQLQLAQQQITKERAELMEAFKQVQEANQQAIAVRDREIAALRQENQKMHTVLTGNLTTIRDLQQRNAVLMMPQPPGSQDNQNIPNTTVWRP